MNWELFPSLFFLSVSPSFRHHYIPPRSKAQPDIPPPSSSETKLRRDRSLYRPRGQRAPRRWGGLLFRPFPGSRLSSPPNPLQPRSGSTYQLQSAEENEGAAPGAASHGPRAARAGAARVATAPPPPWGSPRPGPQLPPPGAGREGERSVAAAAGAPPGAGEEASGATA